MARGSNGLAPTDVLRDSQKCPEAPGKRKFYNLQAAEKAAADSSRQYHTTIVPYACPGCGLWHVTGKVRGSDVARSNGSGVIKTAAMIQRENLAAIPKPPVERRDMTMVEAMESPIVPGNREARLKMLTEYLDGRESVTMPEVVEAISATKETGKSLLNELGWTGQRGRKEWYPADKDPARQKAAAAPAKPKRGRPAGSGSNSHASRLRKLRTELKSRDSISTLEVQELTGAGKDQAKTYMRELGWQPGWGVGAKWTPGPDWQTESKETTAVTPDPIDLATRRHPSAAGRVNEEQTTEPAGEWRTIPTSDQLAGMTLEQMQATLAPFGFDVRIQVRGL